MFRFCWLCVVVVVIALLWCALLAAALSFSVVCLVVVWVAVVCLAFNWCFLLECCGWLVGICDC